MDRIRQDLLLAVRLLRKDLGFTIATIATLGLCIAANVAIFAIVNSVLLKPLPFPESGRIVTLFNAYPGAGALRGSNGVPDYFDRLNETDAFEELAVYRTTGMTIGGQGASEAERFTGTVATPSYFRLLRVQPARGRLFSDADAEPGEHEKVLLSHGLWLRLYGGRDEAVGQDLRVNGLQHTIVGVLPDGFHFVNPDVQLFTVAAFSAEDRADDQRHNNRWQMIGRLAPGVTLVQAQSQIDALNARNLDRFPAFRELLTNAGFHTVVRVFQEDLVRDVRPVLGLLWGGVLVVLLIGCVNVANLASVRATARQRELVTRMALGAGTGRLAQQIFTESVLLSLTGGVVGCLLGWWGLRAIGTIGLEAVPRATDVAVDGAALLHAFGLVLIVGLVVAALPVVGLRSANLGQVMREEGRSGTASRGARLLRRTLVASQVAFALVLLVGAGLLVASFSRLLAVDPGFAPQGVLTGRVSLPASRYAEPAEIRDTLTRIADAIRALPGVDEAGLTTSIPMGTGFSDSVILAEGYQMAAGESLISPNRIQMSVGYPEAMGMRLLAGRWFETRDAVRAPRTVIVDAKLAQRFWPDENPIGRRMYTPTNPNDLLVPPPDDQWLTVVGVVDPVRLHGLDGSADSGGVGAYYFPLRQAADRTVYIAARTRQDPARLTGPIRRAVASIDAELPFFDVMPMTERLDRSLSDRRMPMALAVGFGIVALFLSAIGLYGVLAYQVAQRRREIGIRMALGAGASSIFRMVVSEGAVIVGIGTLVGLAGSALLRPIIQSQLYEVGALEPRVIASVAVFMTVVALTACLLPARRAARTDAAQALADT